MIRVIANEMPRAFLLGCLGIVCPRTESARPTQGSDLPRGFATDERPAGAGKLVTPGPVRLSPTRPLAPADPDEKRATLRAERQRLSAEGAATGNDPTAIVGFYQASYAYSAYTQGLSTHSGQAMVRLPLTPNWFVQFALPYLWADLNRPPISFNANGTANMVVRTGGRIYSNEFVHLLVGLDATFPTASNPRLGADQYTLGPGVAAAAPMARLRSLAILVVTDYNSVSHSAGLADTHFMQIEPRINTYWTDHWWTLLDGRWSVDWNNRRKTTLNLTGVLGYRFDEHWNVFAGAGGGVVGQDTFLGLDWGIQLGVRWVFGTPLIPEKLFNAPFGNSG